MNDDLDHQALNEGGVTNSKTKKKKDMLALQDLGVAITSLSQAQQAKIPLEENLRAAIEQAPKIKSNSAKKRHLQYIGKLMRNADTEKIEQAYQTVIGETHRLKRQHHIIEKWRDDIMNNPEVLERFIQRYPTADRQNLRQLARAAQKEAAANTPPANARKLFRCIRGILENA